MKGSQKDLKIMNNTLTYIPIAVLGFGTPILAQQDKAEMEKNVSKEMKKEMKAEKKEKKAEKKEMAADEKEKMSIIDTALANEDLSILVTAVKAAGLVEALSGEGPITVFAPTNAAFEKLPEGTVEMLLKPENKEKLVEILKYHAVGGKVMSADLETAEVKTLNGEPIAVVVTDDEVSIDGAEVLTADVVASNGVVHVIDTVLLPE